MGGGVDGFLIKATIIELTLDSIDIMPPFCILFLVFDIFMGQGCILRKARHRPHGRKSF